MFVIQVIKQAPRRYSASLIGQAPGNISNWIEIDPDKCCPGIGKSQEEAVGSLIMSNHKMFDISVHKLGNSHAILPPSGGKICLENGKKD